MSKAMAAGWISTSKRNKIYARDNATCCYCGKSCQRYNGTMDLDTMTLDHIVSQKELAAASTDDADFSRKQKDARNLVVVCNGCNSSKKHTPLYVWCVQTNKDYAIIIAEIARRIAISI